MSDKLNDNDEVLYRQIHPGFMDENQPSSQPFSPTAKDEGKLSVDRSSKTTAESSYRLYTRNGYESAAVYGLTVGEFANTIFPVLTTPAWRRAYATQSGSRLCRFHLLFSDSTEKYCQAPQAKGIGPWQALSLRVFLVPFLLGFLRQRLAI